MVCTVGTDGSLVLIELDGDVVDTREMRASLAGIIASPCTQLIIDLSHVTFLDAAGLYALVAADRRLVAKGGRLHLVIEPWSMPDRVVALTGLGEILLVHRDLPAAVSMAERHPDLCTDPVDRSAE